MDAYTARYGCSRVGFIAPKHYPLGLLESRSHPRLKISEVVAICDHLVFFFGRELEHEMRWEAFAVAFDLLIQSLG